MRHLYCIASPFLLAPNAWKMRQLESTVYYSVVKWAILWHSLEEKIFEKFFSPVFSPLKKDITLEIEEGTCLFFHTCFLFLCRSLFIGCAC